MVSNKPSVLIVDDEQVVCDLLYDELSERRYLCAIAQSGDNALAKLEEQDFEVVLLDIRLPGMSGMEVLREIWLNYRNTATIMITAVDDVNSAVEAMKLGATDYIVKPFDVDRIDTSILSALETKQAAQKPFEMDAIALGVEAKFNPFFTLPRVVTKRTIEVARQLDIAEEEIQRWAAAKAKLNSAKDRLIKTVLAKSKDAA